MRDVYRTGKNYSYIVFYRLGDRAKVVLLLLLRQEISCFVSRRFAHKQAMVFQPRLEPMIEED